MARTYGLPSNLYSGGAVTLPESSAVNYYDQTVMRQKAKEDALNRYFGDLDKNLTPSGMHSNDIPDYVQKHNAWENFVTQNKAAYQNPSLDHGKTYSQAMGMYNDLQGDIQKSKAKVKNLSDIRSIVSDPKKRALLTEGTLSDLQKGELPINHPDYQPIDLSHINYNAAPFGTQDEARLTNILNRKDMQPSEAAGTPVDNKALGTRTIPYTNSFSNDQLSSMHALGAQLYNQHPGWKQMVDANADPLSGDYQKMNDIFKSKYGTDIKSPEDMSAAMVLSRHPIKEGRTTVTKIPETMQDKLELINARGKQSRINSAASFNLRHSVYGGTPEPGNISTYLNGIIDNSVTPKNKVTLSGGTEPERYKMNVSDDTKKLFSHRDPISGKLIVPNEIHVSSDKKTVIPTFYTAEPSSTGNRAINKSLSQPMSVDEFKTVVGKHQFGVKELNKQSGSIIDHSQKKKDSLGLFK